jgi:hypothetical protein
MLDRLLVSTSKAEDLNSLIWPLVRECKSQFGLRIIFSPIFFESESLDGLKICRDAELRAESENSLGWISTGTICAPLARNCWRSRAIPFCHSSKVLGIPVVGIARKAS